MKTLLPVLLLSATASIFATPSSSIGSCGPATLSTYESSYMLPSSSGCAIGILDYSNFVYHSISNAPAASDIFLTPMGQGFGFTRTDGNPFIASSGQVVKFEIDYNILIDPAPIIAGADNSLDPPTGNVSITEFYCNDSIYYYPGTCFGAPVQKLTVGTPASGYPYTASIAFDPRALKFQTVGILFTLDGTKGASSFDGLDATTQVISASPEPAYASLTGVLLLTAGYYIRKQRRNA